MKTNWNLLTTVALGGLVTASITGIQIARADDASTAPAAGKTTVEEIVVTANRREQNMQKVPIAVEAFSVSSLKQKAVSSTDELVGVIPGLTFSQSGNYGTPFLRGVGNSATGPDAEASVATYVDGVYQAEQTASIFSFNNIKSIEVDKGPQGTLFGRNATGGVIQIVTKDPSSTPHADLSLGYGNYDTFTGGLYATSGIAKNLAADIAIQGNDQEGGWGHNVTNGLPTYTENDFSVRTKWLWKPDDDTKVTFAADYSQTKGGPGFSWHLLPGAHGITGQTTSFLGFYDSVDDFEGKSDPLYGYNGGASLRVEHDFGWARGLSITAVRSDRSHDGIDEPALAGDLIIPAIYSGADTDTQEFQLLSNQQSKLNWVLGTYFINNDPSLHTSVAGAFVPGGEQIYGHEREFSYAGYGQATEEIVPDTHLTIGLRYTVQDNHIRGYDVVANPLQPNINIGDQKGSFEKLTWRFALDHQFTPDILGYVSYNRGFKSGFFNLNTPQGAALHPEILDAYEIGSKMELFGHRLRLNTAAFYYQYKEIQVNAITLGSSYDYNGAAAEMYGLDTDFTFAATDNITVTGGLEALHAAYTDFPNAVSDVPDGFGNMAVSLNAAGNPTSRAPGLSGNLAVNYAYPLQRGDLDFNLAWSYTGSYTWDPNARITQPVVNLVNATVTWAPSPRYDVRLWAKNILNKEYYSFAGAESIGDIYSPAAPATFGVTFGAHF